MIKEIKFNGHSATPSDYDCPDGDLAVAMGVIPDKGALRSIESGVSVRMLSQMDVVYVHETANYKHFITLNADRNEIGWIDGEGGSTGELITSATKIADVTGFVKIEGIGNTLLIVTESGITYCLWKDGVYKYLGDHIPDISISFGLVGHPRLFSQSDASKSEFDVVFEVPSINPSSTIPSEDGVKQLTSQVMGKVNRFIREQTIDSGRFCFPFLVRYALRLYDGTSLVGHSAPILMNPSTTAAPIVFYSSPTSQGADSDGKYSVKTTCDIMLMAADLDYGIIQDSNSEQLSNWADIVKSIDVYISKPIYTYDQNGEIEALYDADNLGTKFIGRMVANECTDTSYDPEEDRMLMVYAEDGTSIAPVLETLYSEWTYSKIYELYFGRTVPEYSMHLPEFEVKEVNESIVNTSSFFKLYSIPIEDIELETRKVIEISNSYLSSLVAREAMIDDYLSHDQLIPTNTMVYNQRLHLSGVKRKIFSGFPINSMCAYRSDNFYTNYADPACYLIPLQNSAPPYTVYTRIREGEITYGVTVKDCSTSNFIVVDPFGLTGQSGGYLFYPNANAFMMQIQRGGDSGMLTIDLQPHPFLNGAFAFLDYGEDSSSSHQPPETDSDVYGNTFVPQNNKLFVSEIANPFYFPLLNIYSIGVGDILGISSATKALSEGQFGQFPLYAFTTDGIWALEVSQTGSYSSVRPLSRDVCTNPNGITQIDGAILFATDRGIMLLSGSETMCISEVLDSDTPFDISTLPRGVDLPGQVGYSAEPFNILPFRDFLTGCDFVYDYIHQKIHVFNAECRYAYVYSLESKEWGMEASSIKSKVNSYPEALAMSNDGILLDLSLSKSDHTPTGVLVTRPLKLDSPDVLKTISGIIIRGNFQKGDIKGVVLYGSRDLNNWFMVASSRDHYLRGFSGTAYKYFRIAVLLQAQCNEKEVCITGCTIQYSPKQNNQLR